MTITHLRTSDVYVADLDVSLPFYVDVLGFEKRADDPVDEEGNRWVEVAPPGSTTAVILAHGFGTWSPEKVGGWSRIILAVEDLAATAAVLADRGVRFHLEPEDYPYGSYAEILDPDGNVLGLLQTTD